MYVSTDRVCLQGECSGHIFHSRLRNQVVSAHLVIAGAVFFLFGTVTVVDAELTKIGGEYRCPALYSIFSNNVTSAETKIGEHAAGSTIQNRCLRCVNVISVFFRLGVTPSYGRWSFDRIPPLRMWKSGLCSFFGLEFELGSVRWSGSQPTKRWQIWSVA